MGFVIRLLVALVLAAVLGLGSAYLLIGRTMQGANKIQNGPWSTNLSTGSADADMYTRTAVAIAGLLALTKEETIYYNATTDSAGEPLSGKCSYRIEGTDPDTRWWSITVYGRDFFLIDNPTHAYAVSKTSVVRATDGRFLIRLSTVPEAQNWIATSPDGFDITLRAYNPGETMIANPGTVALPTISKETCS